MIKGYCGPTPTPDPNVDLISRLNYYIIMDYEQVYAEKFRGQVESCYSCGQCESYCPFFPRVFGILEDEEQYGREGGLLEEAFEGLLALCYDCKLCRIACPFKYDLPHIVIMAKAGVMRNGKPPLIKKIFRKVDEVESILGWFAPVLNPILRNRSCRSILQRVAGIHRDRLLPTFYFMTFRMQVFMQKLTGHLPDKDKRPESKSKHKVIYFYGCYTNYHRPHEGMAVLNVLKACGIEVVIPAHRCCGLPQLSEGFPDDARKNMIYNLSIWGKYVASGYDIVVTSSPCGLTIKQDYSECLGSDADFLKGHVFEVTEYLLRLFEKGVIKPPVIPLNKRVAYHVSCHLKAQNMGMPSLELLRLIPGLKVSIIDRGCCGSAGCMGYTEDTFDLSMEIGSPMLEGIRESLPDLAVSDCPKCNLQIRQGTGLDAIHPIELLANCLSPLDPVPAIPKLVTATIYNK